ncbi:hypothetical protein EYF80_016893 [Liparis tanakae]|uniref:Uncharacterized protein n=1 Tax=Liparis tanakae TaxID=230148 RepID=A0A4Z2I6M2_9TELE|nr:hypothetical protein EYF80_016893 [Liparis tanakae]
MQSGLTSCSTCPRLSKILEFRVTAYSAAMEAGPRQGQNRVVKSSRATNPKVGRQNSQVGKLSLDVG